MPPGKQPQYPFAVGQHFWSDLHFEQSQLPAARTVFALVAKAVAMAAKAAARANSAVNLRRLNGACATGCAGFLGNRSRVECSTAIALRSAKALICASHNAVKLDAAIAISADSQNVPSNAMITKVSTQAPNATRNALCMHLGQRPNVRSKDFANGRNITSSLSKISRRKQQ